MKRHILLAKADTSDSKQLATDLEHAGYQCERVDSTEALLFHISQKEFSLVLLEPGLSGMIPFDDAYKILRSRVRTPVLFLTRGEFSDFNSIRQHDPDGFVLYPSPHDTLAFQIEFALSKRSEEHPRLVERSQATVSTDIDAEMLASALGCLMCVTTETLEILTVEPMERVKSFFGKEPMEGNIKDFFPRAVAFELEQMAYRSISLGRRMTYEYVDTGMDQERFHHVTVLPHPSKGLLWIIQDRTEQKTSEQDVLLLAHAVKSIREGVFITNLEQVIVFANDTMNELHGYSSHDLVGKHIQELRSPENPDSILNGIYPATLRSGWHGELMHVRADSSVFPVHLSTTSVRNDVGKPIAVIGVVSDITERLEQEEQLRQARDAADSANRLKSEFLANMGHEFRTPLNVITGCLGLLEDEVSVLAPELFDDLFSSMKQSTQRLLDTIQKVVDIARLHIGDFPFSMDCLNFSEIVRDCVDILSVVALHKHLELNVRVDRDEIPVFGDLYALNHVVFNILDNAIKYTERGSIDVSLNCQPNQRAILRIKDSGIGINEDFLPKIFEDFSQEVAGYGRPYEGTGLGMALAYRFTKACNGHIDIFSVKGHGTEVVIQFPLYSSVSNIQTERNI